MKDNINVEFSMEQKMCADCRKKGEEYYELKLQIRFLFFNGIDNIKDDVEKFVFNNFTGINKMEEIEQGFDYYFRNLGIINKIGKLFSKRYLCEIKRTKKIVGHDTLETRDIWRHTILIKIIDLGVRDIVSIKGENYIIKAFNKNDLVLRGAENGAKKVASLSIVKDYMKLVKKAEKIDKDTKKENKEEDISEVKEEVKK